MPAASVFLALPHFGDISAEVLDSLHTPTTDPEVAVHFRRTGGSLLAGVFNDLWCDALNRRAELGLTHFLLHHADVSAQPGWLDVMLTEMRRVGADVLSAVIPIKDGRGLTSTGVCVNQRVRRLTLTEAHQLPRTFSADEFGKPLAVNTGLMLVDFSKSWVEEVWFEARSHITKGADGRFSYASIPEDWNFSFMAHRLGLKLFATRAVTVEHHGRQAFSNASAWGEWSVDLENT